MSENSHACKLWQLADKVYAAGFFTSTNVYAQRQNLADNVYAAGFFTSTKVDAQRPKPFNPFLKRQKLLSCTGDTIVTNQQWTQSDKIKFFTRFRLKKARSSVWADITTLTCQPPPPLQWTATVAAKSLVTSLPLKKAWSTFGADYVLGLMRPLVSVTPLHGCYPYPHCPLLTSYSALMCVSWMLPLPCNLSPLLPVHANGGSAVCGDELSPVYLGLCGQISSLSLTIFIAMHSSNKMTNIFFSDDFLSCC